MENNQSVNSQQPVVSQPAQPSNPLPATPSKGGGLVGFMNSIPEKLQKIIKRPTNPKKLVLIGGVILIVIIILSIVLTLLKPKGQILVSTPTPEPVVPIATPTPTKYATDSAILQLEENIKILDQNLTNTDLKEENLQPRQLDWTITFK